MCVVWSPSICDVIPRYVDVVLVFSCFEGVYFPDIDLIHILCCVFCIYGLLFRSNSQSIIYHPYLDSSSSPPTYINNSYPVDTDFPLP